MRTEVKIGLVVCIVGVVGVACYMMCSGPDADPVANDVATTQDVPTLKLTKPTKVEKKVTGRTSNSIDLRSLRRTTPGAPTKTVANGAQKVSTISLPTRTPAKPVVPAQKATTRSAYTRSTRRPIRLKPASSLKLNPTHTPSTLGSKITLPKPSLASTRVRVYTVTADDTGGFYGIAKRPEVYGDSRYAYLITEANRSVDSRRLRPGQKLKIPPLPAKKVSVAKKASRAGSSLVTPGGDRQYVVAQNDTLFDLAEKFYGDGKYVDLIRKANPSVNPNQLQVGQKLVIPRRIATPGSSLARSTGGASLTPGPGQRIYTIGSGDLLSTIAKKEYGSASLWPAIVKVNRGLDPKRLTPGMKIILPAKAQARQLAGAGSSSSPASSARSVPVSTGYVEGKPYFD